MGHEKFEANINPTSDGFENFYDSLQIQLVMTFLQTIGGVSTPSRS